ncbi:prepilin-type N-terminal cleavage/methylation domain-containing protein [Colwellia sp. 12G3]|uniref:prepilin-type N-terminal cleavage/methylation domain-containing protein n=1 Tax=Colwellia sp. 12G3 TaxID=2058299 RepID=UPI000C33E625|nr:prepilin-type N-terminal cleavage/methylation domain-containing protein [Colwellia sp. 12G3]PKI13153.1 MSHA biogenesis protein MshC [Colwellia sp. 12G3]
MNNKGFSLIELIVVIILIGILAVSVAPKFDGTSSYEAHTHRAQLISALRLTQQRAMQQTNSSDGYCHQIVFDKDYPRYGVPDRTDCDNITFDTPNPIEDWIPDATGHLVDSRYQITFNIDGNVNPKKVGFDWMGRPTFNCDDGCEINIIHPSEQNLTITIEPEGYIHAFDSP